MRSVPKILAVVMALACGARPAVAQGSVPDPLAPPAADIDIDVAIARNATKRIGRAVERSALYVSDRDNALGLSRWLVGGNRLGRVDPTVFDTDEIAALRGSRRTQMIDARVKRRGAFGHGYFHANPAVSSDLMLLMRYALPPGAEYGRPLEVSEAGLWVVHDGYPGPDWTPPETEGNRRTRGGIGS